MTIYLWNVAAYSIQLAAVVGVALVATAILRIRTPRHVLRYWQAVFGFALILPFAEQQRAEPAGLTLLTQSLSAGDASMHAQATRPAIDVATLILTAIVFGIAVRLIWLAAGTIRLRGIVARSTEEPALDALRAELVQVTGATAAIRITDELDGPATIGVRRPLVLLPRSVLGMTPAVQRAIVCHELLHVKRRDWLSTIADELWCALLWFHPLARVAAARVSISREMVVDEQTILITRNRRAYAEALLAFADPQPHIVGAAPFIGRRTISLRIAVLAEDTTMPHRRALLTVAVAFCALFGTTLAAIDRVPMSASQSSQVFEPGGGVTLPVVTHEVKPQYTREAMDQKIQGTLKK